MQASLQRIVEQFGAESGTIHLIEEGVLVLKAHVGIPPPVVEIVSQVALGMGMAGLAAERNEAISSSDIQGGARPGARVTGLSGALVVPIRDRHGSPCGTLGIGVLRRHTYSQVDAQRLIAEAESLIR